MSERTVRRAAIVALCLGWAVLFLLLGYRTGQQNDEPSERLRPRAGEPFCYVSPQPVAVDQDGAVYDHAQDAIDVGAPRVWTIDRAGAAERRRAAVRGWPTIEGYDRDEAPPAIAEQGGADASVRYLSSSFNRSQGAQLGAQLRHYCDGQSFVYVDIEGQ